MANVCDQIILKFNVDMQGSFWGAILRDSRIFFSKIALILLQCENSRNIDIEASGIELDSFRVDFVLFQWNLRLNSVWVNDTLPVWFRSVNWQEIDFLFLWRPKKFKVSRRRGNQDWILQVKQPLLQLLLWLTPRRKNCCHLPG